MSSFSRWLSVVVLVSATVGCKRDDDRPKPAAVKRLPGDDGSMPDLARTTCNVSSRPLGAAIFLNGKATGVETPASINLWAGKKSRIEVKLKGYLTGNATLSPNLNENTEHVFALKPAVPVHVETKPSGAELFVDGEKSGTTPVTFEVAAGHHTVTLSLHGYVTQEATFDADASLLELKITLLEESYLRVQSFPSDVEFFVDGKPVKTTGPGLIPVVAGQKHFLTATRSGFIAETEAIAALPTGETEKVTVTLETAKDERLENCARTVRDHIKQLEKSLTKLTRGLVKAGAVESANLREQIALVERELAARRVEAEACKQTP
jgi:hypothetical protein